MTFQICAVNDTVRGRGEEAVRQRGIAGQGTVVLKRDCRCLYQSRDCQESESERTWFWSRNTIPSITELPESRICLRERAATVAAYTVTWAVLAKLSRPCRRARYGFWPSLR